MAFCFIKVLFFVSYILSFSILMAKTLLIQGDKDGPVSLT